ncbi:MAG: hemagglutinin repeat-containing protein, partial [Sulfuricella sp.]
TVWTGTQVSAGNVASLDSGGDTTLRGAVVSGKQVVAEVGTSGQGNLNIESLQDSSTYQSRSDSSGFSLTVPITGSNFSIGGSVGQTKADSDYRSANNQSGIKAGDEGFQVSVTNNTDLKGAVIASSDKAVQENRNALTTGTLTTSDIANRASYEVSSMSLAASVGSSPSTAAGTSEANGNASGTSRSAVSGGAVTITDEAGQQALTGQSATQAVASLSRDTKNANGAIAPIFSKDMVREAEANAKIVAAFGQVASKAVGDYAQEQLAHASVLRGLAAQEPDLAKKAALEQQAQAIDNQWKEGGTARVALHVSVGGLSGGIDGALGAGASALAAPEIAKAIDALDVPENVKQLLGQAAGAAIGATVGGTAGAAAGMNAEANNRQLHPDRKVQVARIVAQKTGQTVNPDDIKSRMLFDGEAAALQKGTYDVLTINGELSQTGACATPAACIAMANTVAGDIGSKGAVFVASPQDSAAVRYQTAIQFLGGNFETWLNAPGNEANKTEFDRRLTGTASGLVNLTDFYHVALSASAQKVAQEAGFASGATGIGVVGQALQNTFNYTAKGREAAILNTCTDCPQSMQDKPNLASLLLDIGLSATIAKDVAVVTARGLAAGATDKALLNELAANGVKFTPQNVIATGRNSSGQVVFLETGNSTAGLQHIIVEHASDFANIGVTEAQIPNAVIQAVTQGKVVGYQGYGTGRPIYEITINGQSQRIAVTVGDNGFIVGANPAGRAK